MKKFVCGVALFISFCFFAFSELTHAFQDDFTSINFDVWKFESDALTYGIGDENGNTYLYLRSTNSNPYAHTIEDVFPSSQDFQLEIKFRFIGLSNNVFGSGITIGDAYPDYNISADLFLSEWSKYFFYQIWADTADGWRLAAWRCPTSPTDCSDLHLIFPPDSSLELFDSYWHILKIKYFNNRYETYVDDELKEISDITFRRLHHVWIGDPIINPPLNRPEINIDYVKINPIPPPEPPGFELPFAYPNRMLETQEQFRVAFNSRLTAAFDHNLQGDIFQPFTGAIYSRKQCVGTTLGITCYDGHNGTDFSTAGGEEVFSVDDGEVIFTSDHTTEDCTPNKGGYGCVVIVYYPESETYGLYAHLKRIGVEIGQQVNEETVLGNMGNTGCGSCGKHLHFGVMTSSLTSLLVPMRRMSRNDWLELLFTIRPLARPSSKVPCRYFAPNGQVFKFQDPSSWFGGVLDPWEQSQDAGGCGVESPSLWKFEVL